MGNSSGIENLSTGNPPLTFFSRCPPLQSWDRGAKQGCSVSYTSRLRRLVLCILHSIFFAKKNNKNAAKNYEGIVVWRTSAVSYPETTSLHFFNSKNRSVFIISRF